MRDGLRDFQTRENWLLKPFGDIQCFGFETRKNEEIVDSGRYEAFDRKQISQRLMVVKMTHLS